MKHDQQGCLREKMDRRALFFYLTQPAPRIRATLALLRHFRASLASDCERMRDPTQPRWLADELDKAAARRKLAWLVDVAVNRKAGVPDSCGRRDTAEHRARLSRDKRRAEARQYVARFETPEANARLAHRVDRWWCAECGSAPAPHMAGGRYFSEPSCARSHCWGN